MTFVFVESDYIKQVFDKRFTGRRFYKHQYIEFKGYPSLANFFEMQKNTEIKNVLWTPRWSYDSMIGGSHFFEYKDTILKLKEKNNKINLIFRPHPLMFDHFISKGIMTNEDVSEYVEKLKEMSIEYDCDSMITSAIENADLLITDYSSIIINFFITGKPIIYCKANYELNDDYSRLAEGVYVVQNEIELLKYADMLLSGEDPLAEKRDKIINEYKIKHLHSEKRIVDFLLDKKQ